MKLIILASIMSDNFSITTIQDFIKGHSLEIVTIATSTLAYHLITNKSKKTPKKEDDLHAPDSLCTHNQS